MILVVHNLKLAKRHSLRSLKEGISDSEQTHGKFIGLSKNRWFGIITL